MVQNSWRARKLFTWHAVDVGPLLPEGWQENLLDLAKRRSRTRVLRPRSTTSREDDHDLELPTTTVPGQVIRAEAPWLSELYEDKFLELARRNYGDEVSTAKDSRITVNLNVQVGREMRYECHVDSNPVEGLLYVTDHPKGSGGELVVSHDPGAKSVQEVDKCAATIYPVAGHLIFFDARYHPHYVRPLVEDGNMRVVAAMNYYTASCPESTRPLDLNRHLFGED